MTKPNGPGKKKTFVMSKLIAKFRMAGMPKPTSGGRKRKRTYKPRAKWTPRPGGRRGRRRQARPKP